MSELKPGLYRATVRGNPGESIVMVGKGYNTSLAPDGEARPCYVFTDARPLIVLDLEDPTETVRLMRAEMFSWDCIEQIADAIEAQIKPARIPEPGLWGVVGTPSGAEWVRTPSGWSGGYHCHPWSFLADPCLIREGVN